MTEEHEHVWKFVGTYADWWDGDEDDEYVCEVCGVRTWKYIPR